MTSWPAPTAPTPVYATVAVPGSKSQTNRAIVLAALAAAGGGGTSTITNALHSRDTDLMVGAVCTLGLTVDGRGRDLTVDGAIAAGPQLDIDCGLAGTVLRFVPPLSALSTAAVQFRGDDQAHGRPIAALLDALRVVGVDVDGSALPFTVHGRGTVPGGTVEIDASASSQFVSGLLLSGAAFERGLTVVHTGATLPSTPHIAMTVAMLRDAGVTVDDGAPHRWRVAPGPVSSRRWRIEPDLSNALPFLAAAATTGGAVRITGWPAVSTQPAAHILEILRKLNCVVRKTDSYLEAQGSPAYGGIDADLHDIGELTPAVAVLAALAENGSRSQLRGVAHLRGHETDRLAALSTQINGLGGRCEQTDDGLAITATPLHGGAWRSYADHRMAMAGAILGLRVDGVVVDDIDTTAKTLPEFSRLWADMLAGQDR